ncbi:MAG: sulfatase-like hydrolase/transferase, partial [Verrucomicrobiales bacterium]
DLVGVPGVIRTYPQDNWGRLDTEAPTIAETFKGAGYDTALIGKWHLGLEGDATPTRCGFDYFHGWLGDMMDDYYKHRRHNIEYMREGTELIKPEGHATDLFTDWASNYLNDRGEGERAPFFLFLSYNAPHTPIQPPADWLAKVKAREPGISDRRAQLVALIEHLDDGIGKVRASLEGAGLADDTLIVFTSDNGGQLNVGARNGSNRGGKQEMWEGGIRVPTCVVWPGRTTPARRIASVTMTMDWLPTLAEAAGIAVPEGLDGRSVLPDILGSGTVDPGRTLVWVRREGGRKYGGRVYYAIRRGNWKLLQNSPFEAMQLFDLGSDPMEQSAVTDQPKIYGELSDALRTHINASGRLIWQREP